MALEAANQRGDTPLIPAANSGHVEAAERLIRAGAALEAANQWGETPLILAASNGHVQVVERLIRAGAAPGAADQDGKTALTLAAAKGHAEVVERLRGAGGGGCGTVERREEGAGAWAPLDRPPGAGAAAAGGEAGEGPDP